MYYCLFQQKNAKDPLMWVLSWTYQPVSGEEISLKWGRQWWKSLMNLMSRPMELTWESLRSPRMQICYLILLHPLTTIHRLSRTKCQKLLSSIPTHVQTKLWCLPIAACLLHQEVTDLTSQTCYLCLLMENPIQPPRKAATNPLIWRSLHLRFVAVLTG